MSLSNNDLKAQSQSEPKRTDHHNQEEATSGIIKQAKAVNPKRQPKLMEESKMAKTEEHKEDQ